MANLLFKRGTHASLPSTAVDGAFYLTTDTHRLYAGIGTELVDLNKYIKVVESISALTSLENPQEGDFAYSVEGNVLAVYHDSTWNQVNHESTDTKLQGVAVSGADSSVTITVSDTNGGSYNDSIQFVGAAGLDVAVDAAGTVTLTGALYTLDGAASDGVVTITLSSDKDDAPSSSIKLAGGEGISLAEADGTVTITGDLNRLNPGASSVTVTGGTIAVTIVDTKGTTVNVSDENALYYNVGGVTVYNGSDLPVYSKTEVDQKFIGLNPMTYKGVVNNAEDLTGKEATAHSGDTYMVAAAFNHDAVSADKGDLFIATGEEGPDGVITDVVWTHIPSGDDAQTDTTYVGQATAASNTLLINATNGGSVAGIQIAAGNGLSVSSEAGDIGSSTSNQLTSTISHAAPGANDESKKQTGAGGNKTTFTVVSAVTVDALGHVSSYTTEDINSNVATLNSAASVSAASNIATGTFQLTNTTGSTSSAAIKVAAPSEDNLVIGGTGDTINITLEWGTF